MLLTLKVAPSAFSFLDSGYLISAFLEAVKMNLWLPSSQSTLGCPVSKSYESAAAYCCDSRN